MSVLLTQQSPVLLQGITGKEGQRALAWMRAYGTHVVAGVTPGKGGAVVDGVPVFDSVAQAVAAVGTIAATSIYAPPRFALAAVLEAVEEKIPLIHCIAEGVPVRDTAFMIARAKAAGCMLVGPSSIGLIHVGQAKLGSIGGESNEQFTPGPVALISKSGGLASEFSLMLSQAGLGQSLVVGIGGDQLAATTYADLFPVLQDDPRTQVVVLIGEIGGSYEEDAAYALQAGALHKPVVAFVAGRFAETLPQGVSFGHAGAIVDARYGTRAGKVAALQEAGARIANTPEDVCLLVRQALESR